jgi:hypothetical protein
MILDQLQQMLPIQHYINNIFFAGYYIIIILCIIIMCWSAKVSLNTYILGLFACIFAYVNSKISLSVFIFCQSFMLMQLVEYFIWSKSFSNRILSQLGLLLIVLQPIFATLTIVNNEQIKYVTIIAYLCFVVAAFVIKPWSSIDFRTIPASNGHLAWHWLNWGLATTVIWILFLSIRYIVNKEWLFLIVMNLLAGISYILYHDTYTWGSFWCWISNYVAFYLIYRVFSDDVCLYLYK